jgi:hypothetical protein
MMNGLRKDDLRESNFKILFWIKTFVHWTHMNHVKKLLLTLYVVPMVRW